LNWTRWSSSSSTLLRHQMVTSAVERLADLAVAIQSRQRPAADGELRPAALAGTLVLRRGRHALLRLRCGSDRRMRRPHPAPGQAASSSARSRPSFRGCHQLQARLRLPAAADPLRLPATTHLHAQRPGSGPLRSRGQVLTVACRTSSVPPATPTAAPPCRRAIARLSFPWPPSRRTRTWNDPPATARRRTS